MTAQKGECLRRAGTLARLRGLSGGRIRHASRSTPDNADDPFRLERFVKAQEPVIREVRAELHGGQKRTHWMWFVFPQVVGLGSSAMSREYAISSLAEARAYLDHPVLGERLREAVRALNGHDGKTATDIFGKPDDLKFHSSMTLFAQTTGKNELFIQALDKYFGGRQDAATLARLD